MSARRHAHMSIQGISNRRDGKHAMLEIVQLPWKGRGVRLRHFFAEFRYCYQISISIQKSGKIGGIQLGCVKTLRWVDLMVSKWLDGYGTRMNEYAERMKYPYGRGLWKCYVDKASSESKTLGVTLYTRTEKSLSLT